MVDSFPNDSKHNLKTRKTSTRVNQMTGGVATATFGDPRMSVETGGLVTPKRCTIADTPDVR